MLIESELRAYIRQRRADLPQESFGNLSIAPPNSPHYKIDVEDINGENLSLGFVSLHKILNRRRARRLAQTVLNQNVRVPLFRVR